MPRRGKTAGRGRVATRDAAKGWTSLSWDDLDRWAGSRSVERGEAYQRQGRVKDLVLTEDDRLLATVTGSRRYVTSTWLASGTEGQSIESDCTCPIGAACKHAVAVVVDFLDALADRREVPAAEVDDPRLRELAGQLIDLDDDFGVDTDSRDLDAISRSGGKRSGRRGRRTRAARDQIIQADIRHKSRDELVALVLSLVETFPEVRARLQERISIAEGDVTRMMAQAKRELRAVTEEAGWQNYWTGEGFTPDYGKLRRRLERLVELGHSDGVVELGRELISRGLEQIGQTDDEGETAMALAGCLPIVFEALASSSLSTADKILWAIDACLEDEYDLIGDAVEEVLGGKWSRRDWSSVADELARRLGRADSKGPADFHANYRRDRISDWLLTALENAGRTGELAAVYESEAKTTGSYQRLVDYLINSKRYADAERWAREGIKRIRGQWPGTAAGLMKSLCGLARRRKQWDVVAGHAAHAFFEGPSKATFDELGAAAAKAGCQEPVRAAALRFLETGVPPIRPPSKGKQRGKATADGGWPLPVPDYLAPLTKDQLAATEPRYDVLLEMAIAEGRPDDVLRWYDAAVAAESRSNRGAGFEGSYFESGRVANAVAQTHPERALEIYRHKLDAHLPHAHREAYETCAECLRQMRAIYATLDREDYWKELLDDIRHEYRNRPRFMEILDRLEKTTILQSKKGRRSGR